MGLVNYSWLTGLTCVVSPLGWVNYLELTAWSSIVLASFRQLLKILSGIQSSHEVGIRRPLACQGYGNYIGLSENDGWHDKTNKIPACLKPEHIFVIKNMEYICTHIYIYLYHISIFIKKMVSWGYTTVHHIFQPMSLGVCSKLELSRFPSPSLVDDIMGLVPYQ